MSKKEYFAAMETEDFGKELAGYITGYYRDIETSGYFQVLRKLYFSYFGSDYNGNEEGRIFRSHKITRGGRQGETWDIKVNEFRNLLQHILNMTTQERPAMEAMAINSDSESQEQQELAEGLLEYYLTEQRLERDLVLAAEYGIALCGGFIILGWDPNAGRAHSKHPETGQPINEGDLFCYPKHQLDVVLNPYSDKSKQDWYAVRRYVNRWDLIAEFPDMEDIIMRVDTLSNDLERFTFDRNVGYSESDDIPVFDFYHKRSPAIPEGRYSTITPSGDVLFDGPLPYKDVPVYKVAPSRLFDSPYGYSSAVDLLAIQSAMDRLNSAIFTNQAAFGVQSIIVPRGANLSRNQMGGSGMNFIEVDPGMEPKPLNLTQTPAEVFKYLDYLSNKSEQIAGINSIIRGQPSGQLSGASGAAMALLASQAVQFSYGLQREYEFLVEDIGTGIINILKQYAGTERVAMIAGIGKHSYLKTFSGQDIEKVDRIVVKRTAPTAKTTAGKMDIAKNLLDAGMIETPEQYLTVMRTGNLEPLVEGPRRQIINIKAENEDLRRGEPVMAIATDKHPLHISEHKSVLDDPQIRKNPEIVQNVLNHIQEHIELMRTTDPDLLMMVGVEPLPPQQPPMPPEGPAPGGEVMAGAEGQVADEMPGMPGMPNLPQGAPEQSQVAYEQMPGAPVPQ